MKINSLALLGCLTVLPLAGCVHQPPREDMSRPDWVTDQMIATVKRIGIDPKKDTVEQTEANWRFKARHKVVSGAYKCPAGSTVDISQSVILVMAPKDAFCIGPDKRHTDFVTLSMDGAPVTLVE